MTIEHFQLSDNNDIFDDIDDLADSFMPKITHKPAKTEATSSKQRQLQRRRYLEELKEQRNIARYLDSFHHDWDD